MSKAGSSGFSVLLLDGYNLLSAKLQEFRHKVGVVLEPTGGLGDSWREFTPTGMREVEVAQEGAFFESATDAMHDALKAAGQTVRVLCFAWNGNTVGQQFVGLEGVIATAYEVLARVGLLTKANATYQGSGQSNEGKILLPWGAKTANWDSNVTEGSLDNLASSASGGVGYLQVSALTGFTGATVGIRHSADDITYIDLITFTVATGRTAERVAVAGTVNRHLSCTGTVAGSGSVTPFVGFARL